MNLPRSYTTRTAFDTASDDELYSACPDRPHLANTWAMQLCEAPLNFFDLPFDASVARYDLPSGLSPRSPEASANAFAVAANVGMSSLQIPPPADASLRRASSTPSPGSDKPLNSPSCSARLESPPHVTTDAGPTPKRRKKKRGWPELDLIANGVSGVSAEDHYCTAPIPHNKVERKYREGLNTELERLRRAVPMLLQSHGGSGVGQPKPSKSMVIAAAINYIEMVTQERDMLQNENDAIKEYRKETSKHRDGMQEEIGEIRKEKSALNGGRWSKKRRVGPGSE
ncbi:uncharacterized protein M421DRAFT_426203 [Didymella exigua CBS 183.55]|uniref:BHLH domain-containing protein n=1 Tax=Didymella exigua CBS 183.55 TaxID=1150837 RepID=A0A6A5R8W0_9PLEO|nr:uncharacterized protein M421DRAFT_426203 [Didymella exigua CBS 183.55]KAF1923096.1 hypothetical protein M421DRAFT_426203 [Didymella exigua CBS 183.55]